MVSPPALVSYLAAAGAFLVLAFLSSAGWRGARQGALFGLAAWVSTLWALALAGVSAGFLALSVAVPFFEWARLAAWSLFLVTLLVPVFQRRRAGKVVNPLGPYVLLGVVVLLGLLAAFPGFWLALGISADIIHSLRFGSLLLLSIGGLMLMELLYRSADPEGRWRVKFLCFGLGGLFGYDFVLHANALLYQSLDASLWTARGGVNLLIVPMLAISAARNRAWSIDIQVSRQVVFQSMTVLMSGAYLLLVAGAGYYIRYYGGTWGGIAQTIFLFGAGIALVLLLASGRLRSQLKVYVSKNFFSYQFDYREQWLRFTDILSRRDTGQSIEARALEAMGELVESARGVLWWAAEPRRYTVAATRNMTGIQSAFEPVDSLPRFLQGSGWVVELNEYRSNRKRYEGLELPEWLVRQDDAWLIVPLFLDGTLHGIVLLADPLGTVKVNWEVNDLLKVAGRQAASYIAQEQAARALVVAKQFESFNKMSAFVIHDLKNLVSQLGLILSNAPRLIQNPAFQQDMLDTISNSVDRINRMLGQLHDASVPADQPSLLDVADIVQRAVQSVQASRTELKWRDARADGLRTARVLANADRLERVFRHLLTNAIQATEQRSAGEREVTLRIAHADGQLLVEVADNGIGMSDEFMHTRLFQPFESTKAAGTGLGAYESREYVRAIGGDIVVNSDLGVGTSMRVTLPIANPGKQDSR
jgi:putative PEP-CTERM system histidine kinase